MLGNIMAGQGHHRLQGNAQVDKKMEPSFFGTGSLQPLSCCRSLLTGKPQALNEGK